MRSGPSLAVLLAAASIGLLGSSPANPLLVRESEPLTPEEERRSFRLPEGFEITLFASEPMINKPINLAQDDRGRIWVSSTVEYPYAAKRERWADEQGSRVTDSRDAIKILEDLDGDGRADRVTDFADGLNIPTGVLPWHKPEHRDGCIAWSIPNIWYFADTTGDGRADHREVLFGPLGWEKDTHGMCSSFRLGPDGWVYATHGFNNTSHFRARDGSTLDLHSGNVFRFRPDGSRIEIWSWGQVNPFGLCFDRRGNLYSADCHSAPVYQLIQGAIYPSFGKPHHGLGFGPAMIEHTHGSTGICGITYLDGNVWGAEWNDRVLIGNAVTSRINQDRIAFTGTTPRAIEEEDFLVSGDPWFRPVDLCLGGDGALYVADFYNRIIGHYEVPLDHPGRDRERGRIWRITRTGATGERRPAEPLQLTRHPISAILSEQSPFLQRAAAAQFRNSPQIEALPALLTLLEEAPEEDTHLRHVVLLSLREHLALPGALAQLPVHEDFAELVLAVPSKDAARYLRQLTRTNPEARFLTHIARHGEPNGLPELINDLRSRAGTEPLVEAKLLDAIVRGLQERGELTTPPEVLAWARTVAENLLADDTRQGWVPRPHPDDPDGKLPWVLQPRQCEDGSRVDVLSSLPAPGAAAERLTGEIRSAPFNAPRTLSFWLCGHRGPPDQPAHDRNRVVLVRPGSSETLRTVFPPRNDVCRKVTWDLESLAGEPVQLAVIDGDRGTAYAWLGLTRVDPPVVSVTSYRASGARTAALGQLARLLQVTAPADLRDRLRPFLPDPPATPPAPVSAEERARLDQLIAARSEALRNAKPNMTRGQKLFTQHCATCHQVGGEGKLLGPQLDGIGQRGVARLCEDILDPNRNVDAHFYLTVIERKDGSSLAGFLRAESGALLLLLDASGAEHRIPKAEVAGRRTLPLSLMPPTFAASLGEEEFTDLLGWLLEQ